MRFFRWEVYFGFKFPTMEAFLALLPPNRIVTVNSKSSSGIFSSAA